jgi:PKD repeat protein
MKRLTAILICILLAFSSVFVFVPVGEETKGEALESEEFAQFLHDPLQVNSNTEFYRELGPRAEQDLSICSTSSQGIFHHWTLDETSGNIAYDSVGGNHGSIIGATINQTGKVGTSYWFDGSDDYVQINDNDTLDFPLGKDFGIFAWINTTSNNCRILSKRQVPGDATGYVMLIQSGKFGVYLDFGATGALIEATDNMTDGQWHKVGMVRIGNTLEAFIDGESIGTNDNAGGNLSNSNPLLFGIEQGLSLDYTGYIDDIIFFDDLPPTANAGPDQIVQCHSLVTFDGSASTDDQGIVDYWWNFTDSGLQSLTGITPSYYFPNEGIYTVTLTVIDTIGQTSSDIMEVNVTCGDIFKYFHTDLDIPNHGAVTGIHVNTHMLDNISEKIQEVYIYGPQPGGGQVYYTNRATFNSDTGPLQFFEDFEEAYIHINGTGGEMDAPLDENTNNEWFQPGDIEPGIQFWDIPATPDGLCVVGIGFSGNPTVTVCTSVFSDSMDITFFNNDTCAVGMDLQSYFSATTFTITIYGVGGGIIDTTTGQANNAGLFWGVISDEIIGRINLYSEDNTDGADNIAFGSPVIGYSLDHVWRTEAPDPGATSLTLLIDANRSTGADDSFIFEYSEDNITWHPTGFWVDTDVMTEYSCTLPLVSAPLYLRVEDDYFNDKGWRDTLCIDQICIEWILDGVPCPPSIEIPLDEGWNLISYPFDYIDNSIFYILKDIEGKWDCIQYYDATDLDNHWKFNCIFWPEQINELQSLDSQMGFWINITEPNVYLTVWGDIADTTLTPLKAGWNLVGYSTLNTTTTVADALWGTGADRVDVCDPTDPYRTKEVSSTYLMKPGEGYWVHVPADSVWIVNW